MLWDPTVCLVRATKVYFVNLYPYGSVRRPQVNMAELPLMGRRVRATV